MVNPLDLPEEPLIRFCNQKRGNHWLDGEQVRHAC